MRRTSIFLGPRTNHVADRTAHFFSLPQHVSSRLPTQRWFLNNQKHEFSRWFLFSAACTATTSAAFFLYHTLPMDYSLFDKLAQRSVFVENLPTASHVSRIFNAIYKTPYPDGEARYFHDIRHVSRVAYYIESLYNLYKENDLTTETLTKEQLKLLEIAAVFHDAGREADGKDWWDKESGELFYHYCVYQLHMNPKTVSVFAEAIVNKDFQPDASHAAPFDNTYWKMHLHDGVISWKAEHYSSREKSLIEKLLHDADAIDIQRIPALQFNAAYLDIHQDGLDSEQTDSLLNEVKQLIEMQGDIWDEGSPFISADAYAFTLKCVAENKAQFPVLFAGHSTDFASQHESVLSRASGFSL